MRRRAGRLELEQRQRAVGEADREDVAVDGHRAGRQRDVHRCGAPHHDILARRGAAGRRCAATARARGRAPCAPASARVEQAVGAHELVGVGDAVARPAARARARPAAERRERLRQLRHAELQRAGHDRARIVVRTRPANRRTAATGPASSASTRRITATPVSVSPAMRARSIGRRAAPAGQQRRVQVEPWQLLQERRANELAVGADGHRRHARPRDVVGGLRRPLRLHQRQAELPRHRRHGRRRRLAPAARGPVGLAQDEPDLGSRRATSARRRRRRTRRSRRSRRRARPAAAQCRRMRIACRRASASAARSVSTISLPSRWSISCWMTRASWPSASNSTGSPVSSWRRAP